MEKHNGKIEAISKGVNKGTLFIMEMEMALVEEAQSEQDSLEGSVLKVLQPSDAISVNVRNAVTKKVS